MRKQNIMKKQTMKKHGKKVMVGAMAGLLAFNVLATVPCNPVNAATSHWNNAGSTVSDWEDYKANWDAISSNYENVSLAPGATDKELNFAWYSKTQEVPAVKIAKTEDMNDAKEFKGTQTGVEKTSSPQLADNETQYYSNKVTVSDLEENTQYYYQVYKNNTWSEATPYKKGSSSSYSVLYVGDPQIGACKGQGSNDAEDGKKLAESGKNYAARNDSYNWNKVLTQATTLHNVDFMISAGDQVNQGYDEAEYAGFLSADALKSLPVATSIGNHETYGTASGTTKQYTYHYNYPNMQTDESCTTGATLSGTDYYYTYGDVLFIVLDTNNYNCSTHENVIKKAVEENANCKWRIVTFHQDIYGSGKDHSDSDGIVLRTQLTPIFDKYDIDTVIQGHDHTYSRTYQLTGDGKEHTAYTSSPVGAGDDSNTEWNTQNACYNIVSTEKENTVVDPEGIAYFETNSATGSKFYELRPQKQDYISERSQSWTPTYAIMNVSENALTMTTYDASTGAQLAGSTSYTIVKEADKKALKEAVASANTKLANADQYTGSTVADLKVAVNDANKVIDNKQASKDDISNAAAQISKADAALKVVETKTQNTNTPAQTTNNVAQTTNTAAQTATNEQSKPALAEAATVSLSKVKTSQVKASAGKLQIKWNKVKGATGYEIQVSTSKKFAKGTKTYTIKKAGTTSKTIKGLKKNKKYYVKVCAIKSSTLKGAYSNISNVVVK